MESRVYLTKYKGQRSLAIENEFIRAEFLPNIGSKLCSLKDKVTGQEFMTQREGDKYLLQPYDGNYLKGECSGFDDMFPSIDECYYERYPWKGTRIPDHGEVWTLKWDYKLNKDSIYMGVHGVRFPYRLEKKITFVSEKTLRIDYKAVNPTNFDMEFLWAGHIMINAVEGCRVLLPKDMKRAVCTFSVSGLIGEYGDEFTWPEVRKENGEIYRADIFRSRDANDFQKFYFKDKLKKGWCALKYPNSETVFAVSFPVETVPYLSIIQGEGGAFGLYNVFFEPCTAPYDRIDVAKLHGKNSVLKARSEYRWYLNITVDRKNQIKYIDENGNIH